MNRKKNVLRENMTWSNLIVLIMLIIVGFCIFVMYKSGWDSDVMFTGTLLCIGIVGILMIPLFAVNIFRF